MDDDDNIRYPVPLDDDEEFDYLGDDPFDSIDPDADDDDETY